MQMVKELKERVIENRQLLIYHILAWAFFILYETTALIIIRHYMPSFTDTFVHYVLNILLFYFNAHFIFPKALKLGRFKYYLLALFIVAEILTFSCIYCLINWALTAFHINTTWSMSQPFILIVASLFRTIYIIALSTGYWFAIHFYKSLQKNISLISAQLISEKKQVQLENEIIIAENAYLQAQVSPHLMFNTLNYIYNSIEEISADAAEAVMLLSDISRYSMKRPDEYGLVFLNEELEQVRNFIRLNQLRFNFNLYIDYQVDGNFDGLKIAPLILLGFVENLFKHGDCSDSTYPAQVHVRLSEGRLVFNIRNKKSRRARISHGIGVTNTKMRLDNRYKDNYVLDIDNGDEFYILDLRLKLDYAELLYS